MTPLDPCPAGPGPIRGMRGSNVLSLALGTSLLCACSTPQGPAPSLFDPTQQPNPPAIQVGEQDAMPDAALVVEAYNARVRDLDRLATPLTLLIDSPRYPEGWQPGQPVERANDQVEGQLQLSRPNLVSVRLDKVGQTLFLMGANASRYWWIDATVDPPVAMVVAIDRATPDKASAWGLPVHPLDLLELAAISPLPADVQMAWDPARQALRASMRGRWGTREVYVDRRTFEPRAVWLRQGDGQGPVVAWAELSRFRPVQIKGNFYSQARMPTVIKLNIPAGPGPEDDVIVDMRVIEPRNPGEDLRMRQFEVEAVLRAQRVERIIDLDAPGDPAARGDGK